MIHRCRPDPTLACLCDALARALAGPPEERERLGTLGGRRLFPVPAAREGLLWFLRRAGIGAGDEVAVPALICEVVADSIVAAGARPVIYGIGPSDFAPSVAACEAALSPATKAVVIAHLFGIPADLEGFRALCDARGCLLIEDCAPCVGGRAGGLDVGAAGDCALYSFKYDKPLALGWGGALALAPAMLERLGEPDFPPMAEADDRLLAASLLIQHCLTDAARLGPAFLGMSHGIEHLLAHEAAIAWVCALAAEPEAGRRLAHWCEANVSVPQPSRLRGALAGAKRLVKRLAPGAARRLAAHTPRADATAARFAGKALLPGGLCEHLLAVQARLLADGADSAARAAVAEVYRAGLDPERFVVPEPAHAPSHWLRFPLSARGGAAVRDRLAARAARESGIEAGPYNWPLPVHRVPRLEGAVRVGPGSEETATLVDGLLNLPVHRQVTKPLAKRLVELLNHA